MALVEKYHVVAAVAAVKPGVTIKEGQVVSLNSSGLVVLANTPGTGGTDEIAYGIAGDTKNDSRSSMPGIDMGNIGQTANWQNRVSDYFDETKASGKMTVYHSGGEFATDMFNADTITENTAYMAPLYAVNGMLSSVDTHTTGLIVARLTKRPGMYPSGVPGVDVDNDVQLTGENQVTVDDQVQNLYIEFKLVI